MVLFPRRAPAFTAAPQEGGAPHPVAPSPPAQPASGAACRAPVSPVPLWEMGADCFPMTPDGRAIPSAPSPRPSPPRGLHPAPRPPLLDRLACQPTSRLQPRPAFGCRARGAMARAWDKAAGTHPLQACLRPVLARERQKAGLGPKGRPPLGCGPASRRRPGPVGPVAPVLRAMSARCVRSALRTPSTRAQPCPGRGAVPQRGGAAKADVAPGFLHPAPVPRRGLGETAFGRRAGTGRPPAGGPA